jgi:hypothetical protein
MDGMPVSFAALRTHEPTVTLSCAARQTDAITQPSSGERMTQQTRNIIANTMLGVGILTVVVFGVTHFMTPARPPWRKDMVYLGLAAVIASRPVRGRRRGAIQNPD